MKSKIVCHFFSRFFRACSGFEKKKSIKNAYHAFDQVQSRLHEVANKVNNK